jgi:hypothetical protein
MRRVFEQAGCWMGAFASAGLTAIFFIALLRLKMNLQSDEDAPERSGLLFLRRK